jgi:hypothetical protein
MLNSLSRVEQGDRISSRREAIALPKILLEWGDDSPQGRSLSHNGETSKHQEGITDVKR